MIAKYLDSTNLKPETTKSQIKDLCQEATELGMAAVCVNPVNVKSAKEYLVGSGVRLCTVIGFPLGADLVATKVFAAREALNQGADEIDMVINIGRLKEGDYEYIQQEINSLLKLKQDFGFILKVIVETALLTRNELADITRLVSDLGADYIKTSTGFSHRGVSREDISIIHPNAGKKGGQKD
jgi:deoxyribose-phosphate aldolase